MTINFTTSDGSTGTSDIILARGVPLTIEKTDSSGNKIKITYEGLKMGITLDDLKPPRGNWEIYNETA
jgi:outer membrane lipoprotein-sorting protein